jgi:hypothetical protein
MKLVRVQAMARGFLERCRHRVRKIMIKPNGYFTKGDRLETISKLRKYRNNEKLIYKQHSYKSGAYY